MARATWNGVILAECDVFEVVEGNVYFPAESIHKEYFRESSKQTFCSWKGTASYYDVVVDGEVNADAAWYYPEPMKAADNIEGHIAFWRGVVVES